MAFVAALINQGQPTGASEHFLGITFVLTEHGCRLLPSELIAFAISHLRRDMNLADLPLARYAFPTYYRQSW